MSPNYSDASVNRPRTHETPLVPVPSARDDQSDYFLDATDMRCPLPIIKMARVARELTPGSRMRVIATDPAAEFDIPAWARLKEHLCSEPVFVHTPVWTVEFTVTLQ